MARIEGEFKNHGVYRVTGPHKTRAKPLDRQLKYLGMARMLGGPHLLFFQPTRAPKRRKKRRTRVL